MMLHRHFEAETHKEKPVEKKEPVNNGTDIVPEEEKKPEQPRRGRKRA